MVGLFIPQNAILLKTELMYDSKDCYAVPVCK